MTREQQPVVNGIYMLFDQHNLVYVGKSADCYRRIAEHRVHGRPFDYATVTACRAEDVAWIEASLIQAFAPKQNRQHNQVAPAVTLVRDDAPLTISRTAAASRAAACGMSSAAFRKAIECGRLRTFRKNPHLTGRGVRVLMMLADLDAWCLEQQRALRAA